MSINFWQGKRVRLRPLEQSDLGQMLTSTEVADTEIDRHEGVIGCPLSKAKQRKQTED